MSTYADDVSLRFESEIYCSIILRMKDDLPYFNNNDYWEICDIIRNHNKFCENVHSLIWGMSHFCDSTDPILIESTLTVIRGLYHKSIDAHGRFLRVILPYIN